MSGRAQVAATGACYNWNAQLLKVLWCSLIDTLENDRAELENYSLRNSETSEDHLEVSVLCAETSTSAL